MKNNTLLLLAFFLCTCFQVIRAENTIITVFDEVLFFDGYASLVSDDIYQEYAGEPFPQGMIRHKNSLYAAKLSPLQLSSFGDSIGLELIIKAACDNYDRIGNVNLALVPKGVELYVPGEVDRFEMGRFITPFMNKNKSPYEVPFNFDISYLKHVFKDKTLQETYDFWIELELFGVPYAANKEVAGCAGRNDVFFGTLNFLTTEPAIEEENGNVLIPLFFKHTFNNYKEEGTDEPGKTIKTIEFTLHKDLENTRLALITSNHGANSGGEEYNRRMHYVYFDEKLVLEYKPGRSTCEPFRKYNTQSNGIYGSGIKTDSVWQSFSNWCPGDVIDTRIIHLGSLKAGNHSFTIEVPDAVFKGKDGNIPLSLYFLSTVTADPTSIIPGREKELISLYPNPARNSVRIDTGKPVHKVEVFTVNGQKMLESGSIDKEMDISSLATGMYWMRILLEDKHSYTQSIVKF